jgi:predicted nucleotidyltransferase
MTGEPHISELIRRIVDAVHPDEIILFGSAARGTSNAESDLDVLVIMPDGSHRRQAMNKIYKGLLGSALPVDIVVATQNDITRYGQTPGLVYRRALEEGIRLYAA